MGFFRQRRMMTTMRHRRSQREHRTMTNNNVDGETQAIMPGDRTTTRTAVKSIVGKLVIYIVVLGIVPSTLRRKSTTTTTTVGETRKTKQHKVTRYYSSLDPNSTTTTVVTTVVENVLPYPLASRWSNAIQNEWFRGPNGSWQRSNNPETKWILPSHHPLYQPIPQQLQTFVLRSSLLSKILDNNYTAVTATVIPTNLLISHYTTDSYDPNFLPTTTTTTTKEEELHHSITDSTTIISFHIFLLQKVVGMPEKEEETTDLKDANHTWETNYGGILHRTCSSNKDIICTNTTTTTTITPQFNLGIFWTATTTNTDTIKWQLSPISKVAEDFHTRLFVLSGDLIIKPVEETPMQEEL